MANNEFKTGNFSLLGQIDPFTRLVYVSSIKEESTMIKLLNDIIYSNDQYKIANTVFNLIYKDSRYLEYVIKLLDNNLIDFSLIKEQVADDIINNTTWAFDYFSNNLDKLYKFGYTLSITKSFINNAITSEEKSQIFIDKIIENDNRDIRDSLMISLMIRKPDIKEEDLVKFISTPEGIKSKIPRMFLRMSSKNEVYEDIRNIIFRNFKLFFNAELYKKMELYKILSEKVDVEELKKYRNIFKLYQAFGTMDVDEVLTTLINKNDYDFLDKMVKDKEISFIGSGTTTRVYKVEDKVIKITRKKHQQATAIKDLYLLAPTQTKYVKLDDDVMVVEIQDYLSDTYDGIGITKEDIINWNMEMEKLGYVVTDPLCSNLKSDNFGFLKSYKDANLGNMKESDIPEWFKKRPLVLYDIDLIYRKDDEHKKIMKFH